MSPILSPISNYFIQNAYNNNQKKQQCHYTTVINWCNIDSYNDLLEYKVVVVGIVNKIAYSMILIARIWCQT